MEDGATAPSMTPAAQEESEPRVLSWLTCDVWGKVQKPNGSGPPPQEAPS